MRLRKWPNLTFRPKNNVSMRRNSVPVLEYFAMSQYHKILGVLFGFAFLAGYRSWILRWPYWDRKLDELNQDKAAYDWFLKSHNAPDSNVLTHFSQF